MAAGGYPYLTVNAYNPWAVVAGDLGHSLANAGLWVCDYAGTAPDCALRDVHVRADPGRGHRHDAPAGRDRRVLVVAARRPDRLTLLVGLTVLALAFFVLPTRVHERYAYPGLRAGGDPRRDRLALAGRLPRPDRDDLPEHVRGADQRSTPTPGDQGLAGHRRRRALARPIIAVIALVNGVAFVWTLAQLRPRARDRLEDELAEASTEPTGTAPRRPTRRPRLSRSGPARARRPRRRSAPRAAAVEPGRAAGVEPRRPRRRAAVATMPTWTPRPTFEELGIVGWFRGAARRDAAPTRPQRDAAPEGGGRLDRLDLWLLVMLVIGTMLLRTFRLAEPYQMHFDEVYHARTATEFLQYWRYGLSHDIYEWTHPHLAKYAMAGGLVLWGEDHVSATSDLETPVRAVAIEPRRVDELAPDQHAGERLHVATGTEIRTYDLRTRQLISTIPAAGRRRAGHRRDGATSS